VKKRKHHYVWEHYLRAWATDDQIWCRRAGKYFETNTENVGQRRDFYRLKELSDVDVAFVERLISAMGESAHDLARSWIPYFRIFHKMKQDWAASGQSNPEFESKLDVAINNMEEELHTAVEGPAVPILAALRQGDASSLENDETFAHFAWYIAAQYMRTPSTAQSTAKAVGALAPNFNLDAAWGLLRTIFSSTMGAALYVRRNNMRLTYLRAEHQQRRVI